MVKARAVVIEGKGEVDVLRIGEIAVRDPGPGELLIEVAAAGLNRADVLQRRGFYPAPAGVPANVPGLEYAGTVAELGAGVTDLAKGDRVMGIVAGGGMASHVVVHSREAIRVPEGMALADAAAIPEVFLTAFDALFAQAWLGMGQTVLVHSVGSGVGTAALQLARAVSARALGTSRTQDKLDRCKPLGLATEDAILVSDKRFAAQVAERTGGRGADVILDTVGAAYLSDNLAALATRGTLVVIGLMGGASAELALGALLQKRAHVVGSVLRSRPLEEKAALAQAFARAALPLFARGALTPVVDSVLPMSEVQQAHRRMEQNDTFGKIVLSWV
jgi:putative PIG3 family NAD(P)H quinone oxidoreductase